jgi:hypothetical protein
VLTIQQKNKQAPAERIRRPGIEVDRRKDERVSSHAPLVVALFSTKFRREYASMSFNHSRGGMCLDLAEPFKPGCVLYIRLGNSPDDQVYHGDHDHLRTTTLAEVKWIREYRDKFSTYYRVGVKYY